VLFDDQFDEAVYRQVPWEANSKLSDRVKLADSVVVARIVTVSEQPASGGPPPLTIELQPYGRALAGAEPEGNVRLTLAPDSPSYRLFRWQLPLVLGKDVVLFYRRYEKDDEAQVHFRGEPNLEAVHRAIQQVQLNRQPLQ
jgi:hypothetical protein